MVKSLGFFIFPCSLQYCFSSTLTSCLLTKKCSLVSAIIKCLPNCLVFLCFVMICYGECNQKINKEFHALIAIAP
jgi:hypothetical protein